MVKEMRGLALFIQDIRACKSVEAEQKRINKEMANIRQKFGAKKALSGYDLKKYVSKLVFTFLLGNEIEFGHEEAIQLMKSPKFSEKQAGYLFVSVLFTDSHPLMSQVGEIVSVDIKSDKQLDCCLALHCVANIGGKALAEAVGPVLGKLFKSKDTPPFVKKKVALALLKLLREGSVGYLAKPDYVKAMGQVLQRTEYGVLTSTTSLAIALGLRYPEEYEACVPDVVTLLHRLVLKGVDDDQYKYAKNVTAPWIIVKLLRFLQIFPPPQDEAVVERLNAAITSIMNIGPLKQWSNSEGVKDAIVRWRAYANKERNNLEAYPERNINPKRLESDIARRKPKPPQKKLNACLAKCFEATNLICHYDNDQEQQESAATLMGKLIDPMAEVHSATLSNNPNVRFLALEALAGLAQTTYARDEVRKNLPEVLASLKSSDGRDDPTVHRKAVDVLYNACDNETVQTVVKDLLIFLKKSDYSIREEVVLKIAILAEKYATDFTWYVNIILTLIKIAGDHVTEEVWHRVLQIVVGRPEVQDHAARTCFEALLDPTCHEAMVKVGAYVLGEFGHLIANDPACVPEKQLNVLQAHYPMVSSETRCLLLSTYVKMGNLFPEMKPALDDVFAASNVAKSSDAEIQQRANEYRQLLKKSTELINTVLDEMPPFAEKETSSALSKLEKNKSAAQDAVGRASRPKAPLKGKAAEVVAAAASASKAAAEPTSETAVNNDAFFDKFMLMDNGVLYENPVLQIGCKAVFGDPGPSRAKVTVFYGNRSESDVFSDISTRLYAEDEAALKLHAGDVDSVLKPSVQLQQVIQIDVAAPFSSPPVLEVGLTFQNRRIKVSMKLPVLPNKFYAPLPSPLDAAAFGEKWRNIGGPPREHVQVVTTKTVLNPAALKAKLATYKLPSTDGIDPNPQNCACSAIWTTSTGVIGLLVRVELKDQHCRVTVRASNDTAAPVAAAALCAMLALC
eukprot:m.98081 g.98081  ORF g.98081 m.98081 type:complete len:964 (+) comp10245_c0_seq3:69-2960(+)